MLKKTGKNQNCIAVFINLPCYSPQSIPLLLITGSRINRTHDFGYVALDITGVRGDDEGIYMCRATNDLGEAVTTASINIKSKC